MEVEGSGGLHGLGNGLGSVWSVCVGFARRPFGWNDGWGGFIGGL